MDSLKFHPGPPCSNLPCPASGLPLKWPYNRFRSGPPTGWAPCGRLLPLGTPHAVRLWKGTNKTYLFWSSAILNGVEAGGRFERRTLAWWTDRSAFCDDTWRMVRGHGQWFRVMDNGLESCQGPPMFDALRTATL
jgi:hypothetical protein